MIDAISPFVEPLILEIYLYHNSYKDRLLISELRKRTAIITNGADEDSFFVKSSDLFSVITTKFAKDLKEFEKSSDQTNFKNATSIFFLDYLLERFHTTKYFKVNVSNTTNFTRKDSPEGLEFDYRIAHSKIDVTQAFDGVDLILLELMLKECKLYEEDSLHPKPYLEIRSGQLIETLANHRFNFEEDSKEMELIKRLFIILGPKIEIDDSILMLIVKK